MTNAMFGNIKADLDAHQALEDDARYQLLRSRLLTADQLEQLPPPEMLIDGYFATNSLITTYGRWGTAKTLAVMSMSFCIVTGTPWFGHAVKKGPVLYVAAEGKAGLGQRQRAWRQAFGPLSLDGMYWLPMTVDLLDRSATSALVRVVGEINPVFVVFDTLARSIPGGDENSSAVMGEVVVAADRVREVGGATVNMVHHTPRQGSDPRGHSALECAADTLLLLERSGSQVTLVAKKQKDMILPPPVRFQLSPVGSSVVLRDGTVTAPKLVPNQTKVRDIVWECNDSNGMSATALLRRSGLSASTFYRALKVLVEQGEILNLGTKERPRYAPPGQILPVAPKYFHAVGASTVCQGPPLGGLVAGSDAGLDDLNEFLDLREEEHP